MSIWKELKKVVNSNFNKPLDTQLTEAKNEIVELIKGQRSLSASDNAVVVFVSGNIPGWEYAEVGTFTPKISGSMRLIAEYEGDGDYDSIGDLAIKISNASGKTVAELRAAGKSGVYYFEEKIDFAVSANETYTVTVSKQVYATSVAIGASVFDGSLLDYTITT